MHPTRFQRTQPRAMDATPLLNPTTETGVNLVVVVPSPSCRENPTSSATTGYSPRTVKRSNLRQKQNNMNHHLAPTIGPPAFHAPFARDSTRMFKNLHHTRQIFQPLLQHNMALSSHSQATRTPSSIDNQTKLCQRLELPTFTFRYMITT
jgi:hypothetical protein